MYTTQTNQSPNPNNYKIYLKNCTPVAFKQKLNEKGIVKTKVSHSFHKEIYNMDAIYHVDENSRIWRVYLKEAGKRNEVILCNDGSEFVIDKTILEKKEVYDMPSAYSIVDKVSIVYDIDIDIDHIWKKLGNVRLVIEYLVFNNKRNKIKVNNIPFSCYFIPC